MKVKPMKSAKPKKPVRSNKCNISAKPVRPERNQCEANSKPRRSQCEARVRSQCAKPVCEASVRSQFEAKTKTGTQCENGEARAKPVDPAEPAEPAKPVRRL